MLHNLKISTKWIYYIINHYVNTVYTIIQYFRVLGWRLVEDLDNAVNVFRLKIFQQSPDIKVSIAG